MASVTANAEGIPVTVGTSFTLFCTELIRKSERGCQNCRRCDMDGALESMRTGNPTVYKCHAGLVDFAAPIMVNGNMIGCFVGGQVLTDDIDEELCRKRAADYDIGLDTYMSEIASVKRMSPEQVERSAKLLFNIAKAISSMALHTCSEIEKSRSLEIAARSQSDYIMGLTSDMANITLDYISTAKEALESNDTEKMRSSLETITSHGAGAAETIKDSLVYLQMLGRQFRMSEEEYDPHTVFTRIAESLRPVYANSGRISVEVEPEVPKTLLGDEGGICQLIEKAVSLLHEKGSRDIRLRINSRRHAYAEVLQVCVSGADIAFSPEQADRIRRIVTADEEYSADSMSELGLTIVKSQLRYMSGKFDINVHNGTTEIMYSIPQLKIEGGAV